MQGNRSLKRRLAGAGCALLMLAACRDSGVGDYVETAGKLVVFNYRVSTVTFLVNLRPLRPLRDGTIAVAQFENPAGGPPVIVRQRVWPHLDKITVETPPLRCVRKDRPYEISIRIEESDGTVIQTIGTTIISSQDQELLPERPLVVGPLYTPNPEMLQQQPPRELPADGCPA